MVDVALPSFSKNAIFLELNIRLFVFVFNRGDTNVYRRAPNKEALPSPL